MTRRRARAEALELREDEPHPMALLAARRELGVDLREDSLLGVDEALQAEWIAHRTSCRQGAATPRSVGRVMRAEEGDRALRGASARAAPASPRFPEHHHEAVGLSHPRSLVGDLIARIVGPSHRIALRLEAEPVLLEVAARVFLVDAVQASGL